MPRPVPLLLAGLLLAGCGDERPGEPATGDASYSPAPAPAPASGPDGPPAGFPLALGYETENGDDHSPVRVTRRPATTAFALCGVPAWDPTAGTAGVLGVEWRGEAEWARGRTLVLYPTAPAARSAVDSARDAVAGCPEEQADDYGSAAHTLVEYVVGDQSFGWIDRWRNQDVGGLFGTGLTVYLVSRVGRAVLLTYEYGEGNGSDQTRQAAIARAAKADQPVVDAMGEL